MSNSFTAESSWSILACLICFSGFRTSPVSTLVPLQYFLKIVGREILFMHVDHILPMPKTPAFLHLRLKAQILTLAVGAPHLWPLHFSLHTLASLLLLHRQTHSCPRTLALDVPSLCVMICFQNFLSSLLRLAMHEACSGHLLSPSVLSPSQLHFPLIAYSLLVCIYDMHAPVSYLLLPSSV